MLHLANLTSFPLLFRDYLQNTKKLQPYYQTHYTLASLDSLVEYQNHRKIDRNTLHNTLNSQYQDIPLFPKQKQNLDALKEENTFTVTTGHQLCIFGGPWFVAYKILATIQYAQFLQNQSSKYTIVPIFWLASEDHDIAEIQTFYLNEQKIEYLTDYQGITGNLPLQNIENTLDIILPTLKGLYANATKQILQKSYRSTFTLGQATRLFIQNLFGHLGILVLEPHTPELKTKLLPIAEKEIAHHITHSTVQKTIKELHQLGYKTYANPNPVNLFYIYSHNLREKWDTHHVLNPNKPQHISPNVLLRPIYQELILPNLAYVGGPTEIAYWLELKALFEQFTLPYPVLVPRYFGLRLSTTHHRIIEKYQWDLKTMFNTPKEAFLAQYFEKQLSKNSALIELEHQLNKFNTDFYQFIENQGLGLERSARSTITRIEKEWRRFHNKLRRAIQKREDTVHAHVEEIYKAILPLNISQDRVLSYLSEYAVHGNVLWETILEKPIIEPYFWIWEV